MNAITQTHFLETKSVRLVAISLLLALLSACGSNVTPRATTAYSGGGPTATSPLISANGDAEAECTSFDSLSVRLGGKVTTYYYNGTQQEDKVRVRITSLVETFDSNSNYYIQAFRWRVNADGTSYLDPTALQFHFESGNGSVSPISSLATSVSARGITAIRGERGITGTGAVDFFSKTTMVVNAVDYNWQAMKIVVYDGTSTPAKVVGQVDLLLPIFQANPTRYAATHHATLTALHPFLAQSGQTLSESDWGTRANGFCF